MGNWQVRNGLDFGHTQHSKVGVPLVESIQRIVVATEVFRGQASSNSVVEHAAHCPVIDNTCVDTEANDPPRVLVHDHQNPVGSENRGLTAKQVDAPEAVFRDQTLPLWSDPDKLLNLGSDCYLATPSVVGGSRSYWGEAETGSPPTTAPAASTIGRYPTRSGSVPSPNHLR